MSIIIKLLEKKKNVTLIFLFFAFIILLVGYFNYLWIKDDYLKQVQSELKAVAELKINNIEQANFDEIYDAALICSDQNVVSQIEKTIQGKSGFRQSMFHYFEEIKLEHNYEAVLFISPDYKLVISPKNFNEKISQNIINAIELNKHSQQAFTTDIYFCETHREYHLDYISGVRTAGNKLIGYILFRKNPDKILFPLVQNYPGERKSSEVVLVKKVGEFVTPVTPLRYKKNAQLNVKIPLTKKNFPGVEAIKGEKKFFEGVDYRNVQVISYLSPIRGTNWFMVAKIDKAEIYTKIFNDLLIMIFVLVIILSALFFSLFWFHHYQERNFFRKLYNEEKSLRRAEEEYKTILYSIGDAVIITDESGKVKNINPVAENLTGWREEEAVGKSIEVVFNIINEQTRNKVENPVDKVIVNGTIVGLANHTMLISKEGKEIPIADSGAPVKDEEGKIIGVVLVFRDQTKEREAKRLIEQSEARLNRGEIVSKSGNWELHLNTKKMFASEGAAKIYGVSQTEIDYEFVKSVPLPEFRPMLDSALINLIQNNAPYDVKFKIKAIDTNEIKDIHSVAVYDKEKNILFGVIQDITAQQRISDKLIESQSALLALINNKEQSIWSLDENFNLIICNDYFKNAYKAAYNFELEIGINMVEILSPHLKKLWQPKYEEALSGKKVTFEFSEIINGEKYYFEIFLNPIYVDDKIKGVTALSVDITDFIETKKSLEESEKNYKTIFDSSSEAIFIHDSGTGKIIDVNDAMLKMYGYSIKEEILAGNIGDLSAGTGIYNQDTAEEFIRKTVVNSTQSFEWLAKRKDGSTFWIEVILKKIILNGIERVIAMGRDIDERKKSEAKIIEQLEELKRWQNVMLDREDRVIELKNEVNELLEKLGKSKKYEST